MIDGGEAVTAYHQFLNSLEGGLVLGIPGWEALICGFGHQAGEDFRMGCEVGEELRDIPKYAEKSAIPTMPRKAHTLVEDFGVGQLRMRSTFEPSASIPAWEILWPRKRIESWNSLVFFLLQ